MLERAFKTFFGCAMAMYAVIYRRKPLNLNLLRSLKSGGGDTPHPTASYAPDHGAFRDLLVLVIIVAKCPLLPKEKSLDTSLILCPAFNNYF